MVDVETLAPVANANVTTQNGTWQTDSTGKINIPANNETLVLSHVNYEERIVNLRELKDTIFLISKLLNLKEVVIFGEDKQPRDYTQLKKSMLPDITTMQLIAAGNNMNGGGGLNLMGLLSYLLPEKWKMSKKERRKKKLKEILEKY